jgi:two-component system invasion response regulator UvrY
MQGNNLSAVIADGQPLVAAGLETLLTEKQGMAIVGRARKGDHMLSLVEKFQPALLIADYNVPGFISLDDIRNAISASSKTNVLILSSDDNKTTILSALNLGVKGYVTKECSMEEVGMAIQATVKGEKFFCHKVLDIIMEKHLKVEPDIGIALLTSRETEILTLIAHGKSTMVIAEELFLSPHTVQTHRKSIIKKLNIKSPTEFVIYALDFGLLKLG